MKTKIEHDEFGAEQRVVLGKPDEAEIVRPWASKERPTISLSDSFLPKFVEPPTISSEGEQFTQEENHQVIADILDRINARQAGLDPAIGTTEEVKWQQYPQTPIVDAKRFVEYLRESSDGGLRKTDNGIEQQIVVRPHATKEDMAESDNRFSMKIADLPVTEVPDDAELFFQTPGGAARRLDKTYGELRQHIIAEDLDKVDGDQIVKQIRETLRREFEASDQYLHKQFRAASRRHVDTVKAFDHFQPTACTFNSGKVELKDSEGYTVNIDWEQLQSLLVKDEKMARNIFFSSYAQANKNSMDLLRLNAKVRDDIMALSGGGRIGSDGSITMTDDKESHRG